MMIGTIFGTIISGVLVFFFSQIILEVYVKPLQEYKNIKRKVSFALVYYANRYCNVMIRKELDSKQSIQYNEMSEEIRKMGAELESYVAILPKWHLFIPKEEQIKKASTNLILISNCMTANNAESAEMYGIENHKASEEIKKALNIK